MTSTGPLREDKVNILLVAGAGSRNNPLHDSHAIVAPIGLNFYRLESRAGDTRLLLRKRLR